MVFQEKLIIDLQNYLKVEVPEIRFIDENLGQWGDDNFRSAVSFPALLIDFPTTVYSEMGGTGQLAELTIEFTLLFAISSQSYNLAPLEVKKKALSYYEIEQKLVAKLNRFAKDYITPLQRNRALSRNRNEIGLRIRELYFTTEYMEEWIDDWTEENLPIEFTGLID